MRNTSHFVVSIPVINIAPKPTVKIFVEIQSVSQSVSCLGHGLYRRGKN